MQQPPQLQLRLLKSSQMKKMLSAPHVLSEQGLLQAGWKGGVFWPVHSRLRSSSTRAGVDGAPLPIHMQLSATSESGPKSGPKWISRALKNSQVKSSQASGAHSIGFRSVVCCLCIDLCPCCSFVILVQL